MIRILGKSSKKSHVNLHVIGQGEGYTQLPTYIRYPDISPGHFPPELSPPDEKLYISWTNCHKSNFYLHTTIHQSHFHFNKEHFSSNVRVV